METLRLGASAMRVRFELLLIGSRAVSLRAAGEEALEEILRVERALNPYDGGSDLAAIHAARADQPVRVSALTRSFLRRAIELSLQTGRAFDPTLGGRLDALAIDDDAGTVTRTDDTVRIDPGALGKGWALDRAGEILRELGVECALLHGGTSSSIALGTPPESPDGWSVAAAGRTIRLQDSALSVSSNRHRDHVIDPRTGKPLTTIGEAAAVCASATVAEALSTALLVAGAAGEATLRAAFPEASLWRNDG
jgi:thiamine biosynthesis lipoprotein